MGDESIDLSKFGTALFAFGFVLITVLSIFGVAKSISNNGSDKVIQQLDTVEQSELDDYDQATVLGTKVKAAYNNFAGKPYAIVIATRSMIDKATNVPNAKCPGLVMTGADAAPQIQLSDFEVQNSKGTKTSSGYFGINYNALLELSELTADNGNFVTQGTFKTDDGGTIQYNAKVSNMKKQGTAEFIPTGAHYMSSLIKDNTGSTCGIVFIQTSAN